VEVLVRLRDEDVVEEVGALLDLALDPGTTAWELGSDAEWRMHRGERHLQDELIVRQRARRR
jgi:polyphosphate kinase